jgi:hypothetical protein
VSQFNDQRAQQLAELLRVLGQLPDADFQDIMARISQMAIQAGVMTQEQASAIRARLGQVAQRTRWDPEFAERTARVARHVEARFAESCRRDVARRQPTHTFAETTDMDREQLTQAALQLGLSQATVDMLDDAALAAVVLELQAKAAGPEAVAAFAERFRRGPAQRLGAAPRPMSEARRRELLSYGHLGPRILDDERRARR